MSHDQVAFRRRGGSGPVFTSTKCPPGPGLMHSCELPFGFIWTPMSPSDEQTTNASGGDDGLGGSRKESSQATTSLPPVLCLTCLAYMNLYSLVEETTGVWTCSLCGAQNVLPTNLLHGSNNPVSLALVSPICEYQQAVNTTTPIIPQEANSLSYILVLDGNLPSNEVKAVVTQVSSLLLLQASRGIHVQLALVVYKEAVSIYQLGITGMASADVYPCLSLQEDEDVQNEFLQQRRLRMEHDRNYFVQVSTKQDFATLWTCVSAAFGIQMQQHGNEGSSGQGGGSDASATLSRKEKLRLRKEARLRKELSGSTLADDKEKSGGTTTETKAPVTSPWTSSKTGPPLRCTGEATQCAVDLSIFGPSLEPQSSRILLFTNGCPNVGIGSIVSEVTSNNANAAPQHSLDSNQYAQALEYFDVTGKYAFDNGIGIDVFCTGAETIGIPVFSALTKPSEGYALTHDSFMSPPLARNLNHVVLSTRMSIADCSHEADNANPATSSTVTEPEQLEGCLADIRMSSFITPTHIGGAGTIVEDDNQGLLVNEKSAFVAGMECASSRGLDTAMDKPSRQVLEETLSRIRLGRYDPLSTLSVMLQVNEEFLPDDDRYAIFQCIVRFVDPASQELVTRVCTNRLPVALSVHDFLESSDEEAVPVVLGKEAVYRSIVGREEVETAAAADMDRAEFLADEAQRDLDATVHRISGAFRLLGLEEGNLSDRILAEEGRVGASPSSLDFAFPPELADALHRLFHLRRGSLLSPGPLQSADDRAEKRSLFLRLPLDDCLCMMAPSLWSAGMVETNGEPTFHLEQIPSDTLTLWDNRIIAADHHDTLFVWSGKAVLGAEYDNVRKQCKEFLLERSKNRFPMPHFHTLAEGDSMSRRFTARLAPSHADPPNHQMVHFPALAGLSAVELTALREKFRFYDEATDASFRRWFWGVASASSNANKQGLSLCE